MKRLTITAKIWLSIGVFILGWLIALGVGQVQALLSEQRLVTTSEALFPAAQQKQEADAAFQRMVKGYQDGVLLQDTAALDNAKKEGDAVVAHLESAAALPRLDEQRAAELKALAGTVRALVDDS